MKIFDWFKRTPKKEVKESRVARLNVIGGGGSGVLTSDKDYEKFARESYLKNVIAFKCIDEIAKAACQPRWELHRRIDNDNTELITDHEINAILNRPNPDESWSKLVYKWTAFLLMTGNAYPERVVLKTRQAKYPAEMYCIRPDRIKPIINKFGQLEKYEYRTSAGVEYFEVDVITKKCDLLHIATFHPTDDFYGVSFIEPAAREIDSSNEATDWNLSLIRNQGRPGMVFTLVGDISDDQFDSIERQIDEKFSGPSGAGKSIVITGDSGTKAEPYTSTLSDMEFTEGGRELARRISLAAGVPPILIGIPGDSTYNNRKEARLEFNEITVSFYINLLRNELNNWLFDPADKLLFKLNWDDVPAMEPRWETKWKRAQEADFLMINEKREMVGYEKHPMGDVILVPAGMIPLEMAVAEPQDPNAIVDQAKKISKDDEEFNLLMGYGEN